MTDTPVLRELEDCVLTLTLNRPDVLNALNASLLAQLREALDEAATNQDVGAVVLRGAGRAFCAGGDLRSGATEALHLTRTRYTEDHREAARAFAEKRPPVFRGK